MGSGGSTKAKDSKDAKNKTNGKQVSPQKENSTKVSMKDKTKGSKKDNTKQNNIAPDIKKEKGNQNVKNNKTNSRKAPAAKKNEHAVPPEKERGYKKLTRGKLRDATAGSDIQYLEHAIDAFETNQLEDDGDLTDAYDHLEFLTLKKEIRDANLRRHPNILEKAIADVESSSHKADLQHYLDKAKETLHNLQNLDNYRHEISTMDQKAISEVRSYNHPPPGVHEAIMSTYLLLGYEEEKVKDWQDLRALLGRHGKYHVLREISEFDESKVTTEISNNVKKLQNKFTQDEVRAVSSGAASFYVWNDGVIGKEQDSEGETTKETNAKNPKTTKKIPPKQSQSQGASTKKKTKG